MSTSLPPFGRSRSADIPKFFCSLLSYALVALFILFMGSVGIVYAKDSGTLLHRAKPVMGTFAEVTLFSETAKTEAIDQAFSELERIDALLSDYRPESELSKLNWRGSGRERVVSMELFQLLSRTLQLAVSSEGAFDITVRPLMRLWGFRQDDLSSWVPPNDLKIQEIKKKIGYQKIQLVPQHHVVQFLTPDIELDLGGIGKGYAVDRAVQVLKREGITGGMVRLGGDILVFGAEPAVVGIQHPREADAILANVCLQNRAISTSGNYEHFVTAPSGKRYGHLIDPRTGYPVSGECLSTTVIAPSSELADALATAIFVLGEAKGRKLLQSYHAEGLWVYRDQEGVRISDTDAFPWEDE